MATIVSVLVGYGVVTGRWQQLSRLRWRGQWENGRVIDCQWDLNPQPHSRGSSSWRINKLYYVHVPILTCVTFLSNHHIKFTNVLSKLNTISMNLNTMWHMAFKVHECSTVGILVRIFRINTKEQHAVAWLLNLCWHCATHKKFKGTMTYTNFKATHILRRMR